MTPLRIVRRAREQGLDIIAISDHNSAENLGAAVEVAATIGLSLIPAMEAASIEEAHVLGLFETLGDAMRMQEYIYEGLPDVEGAQVEWGTQVVVNTDDEVMGFNDKPLIAATTYGLGDLVGAIRSLGGLAVASHVDREAFSVLGQLGFVPDDVSFDAFEVVRPAGAGQIRALYPDMPWLSCSDAHMLGDIGIRRTSFFMKEATFAELAKALRGEGGRSVACA